MILVMKRFNGLVWRDVREMALRPRHAGEWEARRKRGGDPHLPPRAPSRGGGEAKWRKRKDVEVRDAVSTGAREGRSGQRRRAAVERSGARWREPNPARESTQRIENGEDEREPRPTPPDILFRSSDPIISPFDSVCVRCCFGFCSAYARALLVLTSCFSSAQYRASVRIRVLASSRGELLS